MQVFLTAAAGVIIYGLYRILHWYVYYIRPLVLKSASLPHPPKHWLFGNLKGHPGLGERLLDWWSGYAERYGGIYRVFHGLEPQLYLSHPEVAKVILRSSEPKPMVIPGYAAVLPWLGRGLLLSEGSQWHRNRHLLTPAFHFKMLKNYLQVFNRCGNKLVEKCVGFAKSGISVDIYAHMTLLSLDTILRCAFSYENDIQESVEKHQIAKLAQEATSIALKRSFNPIYWPEVLWWVSPLGWRYRVVCKKYNDITRGIIHARKQELEEHESYSAKNHDFLDMLLKAKDEDGKGLSEDEIRAEVNTFLFAGFDTTSSAMSWILYQLARYPEHQELCRTELEEIMGGRSDDEITWEDVLKLNYLTMCIKETLRMFTTVPVISRNPDVWEDPDVFRPMRFHPDEVSMHDAYAFVPFSAGPRNCIGQNFALTEIRVIASKIIRNFRISVDETHPSPKQSPEAVMRSENGIWLNFENLERK